MISELFYSVKATYSSEKLFSVDLSSDSADSIVYTSDDISSIVDYTSSEFSSMYSGDSVVSSVDSIPEISFPLHS